MMVGFLGLYKGNRGKNFNAPAHFRFLSHSKESGFHRIRREIGALVRANSLASRFSAGSH
jgi:hypothetical protein